MEEYHFPTFELIMAPITILVFIICAIIILCMIIHLTRRTINDWKAKEDGALNKIYYLLLIGTIFGISCFEISLVCIIIITTQLFLMDDVLKKSVISSDFFFSAYGTFQYFIAIFDSLGHLLSLLIFIARFDCVFKISTFNPRQSRTVVHFMYIMLIVLALISFVIMFYVLPFERNPQALLTWEIAWELCVESMIIFVLILFISKLYNLLKFTFMFPQHMERNTKHEFVANITAQRDKESDGVDPNASTMTIDGVPVVPANPTQVGSNSIQQMQSHENQALELLSLMSKLTVLVIVSAVGSFLTIVGNLVIETYGMFNEKQIGNHSHAAFDHDAIWVFVLPVVDIVLTTFMLYLQFGFTRKIYYILCNCLDKCFLKCMVSVMFCCWSSTQKDVTFMVSVDTKKVKNDHERKSRIELNTTSPQSNELDYTENMPQTN